MPAPRSLDPSTSRSLQVDSHQHFWSLARGDYGWLTPALTALYRDFLPDDLRPLLVTAQVARTVLVQAAPTLAETRYLLDLARQTPFVGAAVGWVDLLAPDAADVIASLADDPLFRGIRPMLQDLPDVDWICNPRLRPAFDALIDHDLSFDALVRPPHLPALLKVLQRHPRLPVVIDHGAKPNIASGERVEWARRMRTIARESTACCKISGLVTEAAPGATLDILRPYLDVLFECFGPHRLMWGSDWPVINLACDYPTWRQMTQLYLEQTDAPGREAVLGRTAARFYRIAPAAEQTQPHKPE